MSYPFKQKKVKGSLLIREFSEEVEKDELVWHRDKLDREITVIESNDWLIQRDNELPQLLEEGKSYFIKAKDWHRVVKGKGRLLIAVKENG